MTLIGDFERLFATSLYPLRVPIAIGLLLLVGGLVLLARRRGWPAAARKHPRRTATIAIALLAAGLPLGWYLASPLFIRTALVEPAPVVVAGTGGSSPAPIPASSPAAAASPAAAKPSPAEPASPTPSATPEPTPFAPTTLAVGTFRGADDFHFGEGTATIIETEPGRYLLRFEAFSVRNGPDLYVYLSPDGGGYADGALELGTLKATDGAFGYELPEGTDPADFASAVVWCKQFAVLFAVAPLTAV